MKKILLDLHLLMKHFRKFVKIPQEKFLDIREIFLGDFSYKSQSKTSAKEIWYYFWKKPSEVFEEIHERMAVRTYVAIVEGISYWKREDFGKKFLKKVDEFLDEILKKLLKKWHRKFRVEFRIKISGVIPEKFAIYIHGHFTVSNPMRIFFVQKMFKYSSKNSQRISGGIPE